MWMRWMSTRRREEVKQLGIEDAGKPAISISVGAEELVCFLVPRGSSPPRERLGLAATFEVHLSQEPLALEVLETCVHTRNPSRNCHCSVLDVQLHKKTLKEFLLDNAYSFIVSSELPRKLGKKAHLAFSYCPGGFILSGVWPKAFVLIDQLVSDLKPGGALALTVQMAVRDMGEEVLRVRHGEPERTLALLKGCRCSCCQSRARALVGDDTIAAKTMAYSSLSVFEQFTDIKNVLHKLSKLFVPYCEELLKKDRGILTQEDVIDIQKALEKWNLGEAASKIKEKLEAAEKAPLNIAVTGESGSGKSTFINALRGLGAEEEGSAPTGAVETTTEPTPYQHPKFPNVILWDLPSIGTPNFQPEEYLIKVEFKRYDFMIIITSEQFKSCHVDLAREVQRMDKKFYFVRTKTDQDLANAKKGKRSSYSEESLLQLIRDSCLESLKKGSMSHPRLFLISSSDMGLYDFHELEDTLVKELPAHKRHAFLLAMPIVSEEAINRKKAALQEKIGLEATIAALQAAIPFSGIFTPSNREELEKCLLYYRSLFGVDDLSLAKLAEKRGRSVQDLKAIIKSRDTEEILKNNNTLAELVNTGTLKTILSCIPLLGNIGASAIAHTQVSDIHWHALDTVTEDAKNLLKELLESLDRAS
ncbi:interferon-inducible GTPase 1-like [Tachyglossus aculeatus]|uniref:interferon-inducible GTPase 1-like n=1 Tax=Tachyglossus aculeatus TaxID=9261 RepID=UPI0018F7A942|nr:interferon-inducible GTPase 1-like [Tachyglossus aculeatus]